MHNYKPWGKIIYYNGFDKKHHSGMKYGIGLGGVEEGPRRHLQSNTQNHRPCFIIGGPQLIYLIFILIVFYQIDPYFF